jgi:type II secretory pathway component PulF
MIRRIIYTIFMALPHKERMRVATWRFGKLRENFYRETRLDVAAKGLRNRETLLERLTTLEKRHRDRKGIAWVVFHAIARRMVAGDDFASAIRPYIPSDEYALLEIAGASTQEDAAVRGLELAEMAANAKGLLASITSLQMAYPALLLVDMYGFCILFGGTIFPTVADTKPVSQWTPFAQWLFAIDTFCYQYWWLSGAIVAGAVITYFHTLRRWTGEMRNQVDAMPLMWRNRRDLRAALLIVSFAGLFDSNLTLRASLDRLTRTADPWLKWHLNRMSRRLTQRPDQTMRALDTGIFSEEVMDTISDAAGRDQFVQAIKSLGRSSLDRVVATVRRNARITHYVLMGFAILLFFVLGVGSYVATGAVSFASTTAETNY